MSRVLVGAAGVGDDIEVALVGLCHYEVINDASFLSGEEGQRPLGGEGGERERGVGEHVTYAMALFIIR